MEPETLEFRLRERARIRRQIPSRKSVQENQPDRLSDLLEEAADRIMELELKTKKFKSLLNLMIHED